jgi:hypothetical protein
VVSAEYGVEDLGLFFGWECVDEAPEVGDAKSVE